MTSYLHTLNGWDVALWGIAYLTWRWAVMPRRRARRRN
jgi:hypothetical protein